MPEHADFPAENVENGSGRGTGLKAYQHDGQASLRKDARGSRKLMGHESSVNLEGVKFMKHLLIATGVVLFALAPSLVIAQNHGEAGAYADYFRLSPTNPAANYVGVGGRLTLNVTPHFAMEGEMNYDFARNFTTTASNNQGGGITTSFVKTSVRPLTGLFGPRLQIGTRGPLRAFVTGKIGFINFDTSTSPQNVNTVNASTFTSAVKGVGGGGTHFAAYPGAGLETFLGPIGLRFDIGDEIYLNNGTYNNLRITFGPVIRF